VRFEKEEEEEEAEEDLSAAKKKKKKSKKKAKKAAEEEDADTLGSLGRKAKRRRSGAEMIQSSQELSDMEKKGKGKGKGAKSKLKTLEGGLMYDDLVHGTGPVPTLGRKVKVHYTGTLPNGDIFDSSRGAGRKPLSFRIGMQEVIRGWDLGLRTMRVGGKRKLFIPSALAYGVEGAPPQIPPNSALLFEVDLLHA
jgi:FKBP-type peptidyl-prolyl cis-trans isomerase